MVIVKMGRKPSDVFHGDCRNCGSEMEEYRSALKVERCPREHYEFAHAACPVCGKDFVMYPKGGSGT